MSFNRDVQSVGFGVLYAEFTDTFKAERWEVSLIKSIFFRLTIGAGRSVTCTYLLTTTNVSKIMVDNNLLVCLMVFILVYKQDKSYLST
ncbi:hypothetical protein ACF0H5_015515 [Mactra antiquata]